MDIEQLKLILQTVQGVSSGALTVTIIFLLKGFLETIIGYAFGVYLVTKTGTIIRDAISKSVFHSQLMSEIGTSICLDSGDKERVLELVRKGKAAESAKATKTA